MDDVRPRGRRTTTYAGLVERFDQQLDELAHESHAIDLRLEGVTDTRDRERLNRLQQALLAKMRVLVRMKQICLAHGDEPLGYGTTDYYRLDTFIQFRDQISRIEKLTDPEAREAAETALVSDFIKEIQQHTGSNFKAFEEDVQAALGGLVIACPDEASPTPYVDSMNPFSTGFVPHAASSNPFANAESSTDEDQVYVGAVSTNSFSSFEGSSEETDGSRSDSSSEDLSIYLGGIPTLGPYHLIPQNYFSSPICKVAKKPWVRDPALMSLFGNPFASDETKFGVAVGHFMRLINLKPPDPQSGFCYRHGSSTGTYGLPTCHWKSDKHFLTFKSRRSGSTSAQAIRCLFECSQEKVIDCRTAILFANLRALLELLGEDQFNALFNHRLFIARESSLQPFFKKVTCDDDQDLPLGAWVVFRNHGQYTLRQGAMGLAFRPFSNENAIVSLATPIFLGFGVPELDEEEMREELMDAYNDESAARGDAAKIAEVNRKFPPLVNVTQVPGLWTGAVINYTILDLDEVRARLGKPKGASVCFLK